MGELSFPLIERVCGDRMVRLPPTRERLPWLWGLYPERVAQATHIRPGRPRLKRPRQPKHVFGFLDETGALASQRDPFFAVGLLRCCEPYALLRPVQRIRDRQGFHDEIKWNKVSAKKLPLLRALVDVFVSADASFSAFVVDKQQHDVITRFGGQFDAYDALARQLVLGSVRRGEVMWIIADEYSTPPGVRFEENVRDYVNKKAKGGHPIAGVCRMRSSGSDLLQLSDLLLGAVVYEHKVARKVGTYNPKVELMTYVKKRTGVPTFIGGYADSRMNIAEYGS